MTTSNINKYSNGFIFLIIFLSCFLSANFAYGINQKLNKNSGVKAGQGAESENKEQIELENLFNQGLMAIYRKDYAKAEKQFRNLARKNNGNPKYHYYLGYTLYYQNRMAEALKEFQISYSIAPAFSQVLPKK